MDSKVMTPELERINVRLKELGLTFRDGRVIATMAGNPSAQRMGIAILTLMGSEFALQDQLKALSHPVSGGWRAIESAEFLEEMAGVYPGDPDGSIRRESRRLRRGMQIETRLDRAWVNGAEAGYRVGYKQASGPEGADNEALNRLIGPHLREIYAASKAVLPAPPQPEEKG